MTEEANSKKNQLKGIENFLPWLTRMETLLTLDGVLTRNKLTSEIEIVGATEALKKRKEISPSKMATRKDSVSTALMVSDLE